MNDLQGNTGIVSSLLSRFDLIFIILDEANAEADMQRADHILMTSATGQKKSTWTQDQLRSYIAFVQKVFDPVVSLEAEQVLHAYYSYLRQNPRVSKDRRSVRMLESLIRLCEAHARLLMRSNATVFDAVSVILLMEHSLNSTLFGAEVVPCVLFLNER